MTSNMLLLGGLSVLLLVIGCILYRISARLQVQTRLLQELSEQQKRQNELLKILVKAGTVQEADETSSPLSFHHVIPER